MATKIQRRERPYHKIWGRDEGDGVCNFKKEGVPSPHFLAAGRSIESPILMACSVMTKMRMPSLQFTGIRLREESAVLCF